MSRGYDFDICVIGAGAAGLTVAAGASQLGARVVLVEAGAMGGECLNTGCVPSKALLAAAAGGLGFAAAHARVREAIADIAPHDSVERFEGLGVRVVNARARFVGRREIEAETATGSERIRARRFVIATGSRPLVPAIDGLDSVPYLTNETLFEEALAPAHLIIIGAGPVGVEMAQAWRRLGAEVTLLEQAGFLGREDRELADVIRARLEGEGVRILEGVDIGRVGRGSGGDGLTLAGSGPEGPFDIAGSHLLVAAGREPVTDGLGLDAAGVEAGPGGIVVDRRMRTTNRRIYAAGDVTGPHRLTHMAAYQAGIILRHALFRLPAKANYDEVPQVIFTEPELASTGLTEAEARARYRQVNILRAAFGENDRATVDGQGEGHIKVIITPRGRVLGAAIAGPRAGELIQTWSLAIARGINVKAIASLVAPYPTYGEVNVAAARGYFAPKLFSPKVRKLVRLLMRFG